MKRITSYRVVEGQGCVTPCYTDRCLGYAVLKQGQWYFNPSGRQPSDPKGYPSAEGAVSASVESFSLQPQSPYAGWDDAM
jgi:hypothetical protein